MQSAEVYKSVKDVLTQALNVDDNDITLDSRLQSDLGAESIDLLDITFRLEREFNIKFKVEELFPADVFAGDGKCLENGMVTPHGIAKLKEAMPTGDFHAWEKNPQYTAVADIFTVRSMVDFVESRLPNAKV